MNSLTRADDASFQQAFWAKVKKTDSCWLWTGALANGYGSFCGFRVHRVSYYLRHGMPTKHVVRHLCHVRNCVNPDHLADGTFLENSADMSKAMRGTGLLTAEAVRDIRSQAQSIKDHVNVGRMMTKYNVSASVILPLVAGKSYKQC